MGEEEEDNIKVTLLGSSGVGKTCIIKRYTENSFDPLNQATLVSSFSQKEVNIDGKIVPINLWDTAGQEQYRSLGRLFYKDSRIVILVYDITSKESFLDIKNLWYNDLTTYGEKYTVTALVGNKSDCYLKEEVEEKEAREYAKEIKAHFFLVSAKTGDNIELLFTNLVKEYLGPEFAAKMKEINNEKGKSEKISNKVKKKKKGCC
jgi:small GTP-binding protein